MTGADPWGWRRVDDSSGFDPSGLEGPLPVSRFETHAEAEGYYQGEYRLVPINDRGQMGPSVWQTWFWAGPSLAEEQRRKQRLLEQVREVQELVEQRTDG